MRLDCGITTMNDIRNQIEALKRERKTLFAKCKLTKGNGNDIWLRTDSRTGQPYFYKFEYLPLADAPEKHINLIIAVSEAYHRDKVEIFDNCVVVDDHGTIQTSDAVDVKVFKYYQIYEIYENGGSYFKLDLVPSDPPIEIFQQQQALELEKQILEQSQKEAANFLETGGFLTMRNLKAFDNADRLNDLKQSGSIKLVKDIGEKETELTESSHILFEIHKSNSEITSIDIGRIHAPKETNLSIKDLQSYRKTMQPHMIRTFTQLGDENNLIWSSDAGEYKILYDVVVEKKAGKKTRKNRILKQLTKSKTKR